MNVERLERGAKYLETAVQRIYERQPDRFNMTFWGSQGPGDGFRGCAIGWCTNVFGAEGLTLDCCGGPVFQDATGQIAIAGHAVAAFLEITLDDVRRLFTVEGYDLESKISPDFVAKKIRAFIAEGAPKASVDKQAKEVHVQELVAV